VQPRAAQQYVGTYTWSGGAPPPASGQFESNTGNWSAATQLTFWPEDNTGIDALPLFQALAIGDTIQAQQASNTNNSRTWSVSALPVQNADTTWTISVSSTASSGNNPSSNQNCLLTFTLNTPPPVTEVATWTATKEIPLHWWLDVVCTHGTTRAGVWTLYEVFTPQDVASYANQSYANHRALLPDCDHPLEITPV
jgi:hypothetical protein